MQNPPATHPLQAPPAVAGILQRSCFNCHSNETHLNWYDKIAPASWLIAADVKEARSRFNFSTWDTLSAADKQGRFWEIVNMAITRKMPLPTYAALHPEAHLSKQDIDTLKKYAQELSPGTWHDTVIVQQAEKEFLQFQQQQTPFTQQRVTANGIAYIPDFQNWQVISTTNRFDNHSIRIIYANDIAAKAIRENQTASFPEGSTIVKAVWNSIEEKNGNISSGSLNSVQIMTKDLKKFPDSKGWGFAKFNGIQLTPYGQSAAFNTTCFNCHKIADKNDYIFNLPLPDAAPQQQATTSTPQRKVFDARGQHVIAVFANRAQQSMSVLYGNDAAKKLSLASSTTPAAGAQFTLVTYQQANNPYWFGSYINGRIQSVEQITGIGASPMWTYRLQQGQAPADNTGKPIPSNVRIAFLLSHKPSVFP
ncbi:hypothetical protein FLA_3312 [Filimonas lacunae]|nr:hypothetical protein FLA_3312 [Filimonas lacunae]